MKAQIVIIMVHRFLCGELEKQVEPLLGIAQGNRINSYFLGQICPRK